MKTTFSCVLAILWPFLNAFCQPPTRPLTVGDAVPEYLIRNLVNYKTPTARLSDFKEKLLILDFMASTCGSCMYHLSHLDSLEMVYKDKLQVLPITDEPKAKLLSVLQKGYAGKKISSPFATQDVVLRSWFPHQFVSHMVWIHNGIVKAITKPEYVKAVNIDAVLRNEVIRWPVKRDVGYYDPASPMLSPNTEAIAPANGPALKFYSIVPAYLDGFATAAGLYTDTANGLQRYYAINKSILQLYLCSYGKPPGFLPTCTILNVADTGRLVFNGRGYRSNWKMKNYYCYEGSFPLLTSKAAMQQRMRADLDFYLQLNGHMEKRRAKCIVLKGVSPVPPGSPPLSKDSMQLSELVQRLDKVYGGTIFFNEIPGGYRISDRIYVQSPASLTDIPAIIQRLQQRGIAVAEEERELEFLIITDKAPPPLL